MPVRGFLYDYVKYSAVIWKHNKLHVSSVEHATERIGTHRVNFRIGGGGGSILTQSVDLIWVTCQSSECGSSSAERRYQLNYFTSVMCLYCSTALIPRPAFFFVGYCQSDTHMNMLYINSWKCVGLYEYILIERSTVLYNLSYRQRS